MRCWRPPPDFDLAFTAAVRVVDRVHAHPANSRTNAAPAGAAGLARDDVHVLDVADLTDGGEASDVELADFTRKAT